MDPFVIIKNYRQTRQPEEATPPPRLVLRELDTNAITARATSLKFVPKPFA